MADVVLTTTAGGETAVKTATVDAFSSHLRGEVLRPGQVYGTIRLVSPDRIEYSVPDGVIAVYTPTDSKTLVGGCD